MRVKGRNMPERRAVEGQAGLPRHAAAYNNGERGGRGRWGLYAPYGAPAMVPRARARGWGGEEEPRAPSGAPEIQTPLRGYMHEGGAPVTTGLRPWLQCNRA